MKSIKNNPRPLWDLSKEVAPGFIRLTRNGKLFGYVLLASHYDREDIETMTDPKFWKMIERSRNEPAIPWEQVKAELDLGMGSTRPANSRATTRNGKKGTRHVTARN